jgi:hypothetical protein
MEWLGFLVMIFTLILLFSCVLFWFFRFDSLVLGCLCGGGSWRWCVVFVCDERGLLDETRVNCP